MCDAGSLSNTLDVLHAETVELWVCVQPQRPNEHKNSAVSRKIPFLLGTLCGILKKRQRERKKRQTFKSLRVKKSLGNVIKMQYAYIKYPAATRHAAFIKRHMISESTAARELLTLVDCVIMDPLTCLQPRLSLSSRSSCGGGGKREEVNYSAA